MLTGGLFLIRFKFYLKIDITAKIYTCILQRLLQKYFCISFKNFSCKSQL